MREFLAAILLVASLCDLYEYRVPNLLLGPGLVAGLCYRLLYQGWAGGLSWLMGGILPVILLFILYIIGALGASDLKLFSLVGSLVGPRSLLPIMAGALLIGALMSLVKMICQRNMGERFLHFFNYVYACVKGRSVGKKYYDTERDGLGGVIPFGVAISLSTIGIVFA
ncbi:MAG: prepilin peptidase [Eubacterium sp.]|nr:prepilin peptidase [Eubacterium sp.]